MEPVTLVRPNGSGFMHLQRSLQPGETIPAAPSLVSQLLACRLTHAEEEAGSEQIESLENSEDNEDDF
jgi:hypothetical protein